MKVIGISGSPRKSGNTELLLKHALAAAKEEGVDTTLLRLSGLDLRPCNACLICRTEERCPIEDDFTPVYLKMKQADGIILGSPVYFGSATALVKTLIERAGYLSMHNGHPFKGKVGGPIVVARRAGQNFTLAQLNFWFHILGMVVPGSTYWNMGFGRDKGEVTGDEEGMRTAWNFGKNVAMLLKKLNS
ncbi:MAG: flavodoxin family protein [Dehalococcoidia bacterium]|nr:flavodoxin family protein [Dehalococcoidia bacterium]